MSATMTRAEDTPAATRRVVINALSQPGGLFPSGVTVIFDGAEVDLDILDDAMTWVSLDRQAAKRSGQDFDALASLARHLPQALAAHRRYLASGIGRPHDYDRGRGHAVSERRAQISPRHPMKEPLVLTSEGQ